MSGPHPYDELAAHSLDALDEPRRAAVQTHVEECAECAVLHAAYLEIAAVLAETAPPAEPSPGLRQRLLREAQRSFTARQPSAELPREPVQRRGTRRWTFTWSIPRSVLAAGLALAILGWGVSLQIQVNALSAQNAELSARAERYERVLDVLSSPRFESTSLNPDAAPNAWGRVYFDADSGQGMVMVGNLPPPPPDAVYQIWLIRDGQRISLGTFRTDVDGNGYVLIQANEPVSHYEAIGITREPGPGSPAPTGPRLLRGSLHQQV